MTRDELFTVLTEQGLSEKQANYVLDKGTYHVTPKRQKVVVDYKPEFYTNNDRLADFSKDNSPKNFKKPFPYYNTFAGWKKLGYKVKAGEKSEKRVELIFKYGREWKQTPTAVFSFKQVEELTENKQENIKTPKAEPKKADKQTSKKSEKIAKPTAKKTPKKVEPKTEPKAEPKSEPKKVRITSKKTQKTVTDSELVKASVKTDWIACNPKEKAVKPKARHNKNTKTEYLCDGVTMTVKNGVAYYDDPKGLITF